MATVNEKMTAIADAIREKTGGTEPLGLDAMAQAITALETGGKFGDYEIVSGSVTPPSDVSSGTYTVYTGVIEPIADNVSNYWYMFFLDNEGGTGNAYGYEILAAFRLLNVSGAKSSTYKYTLQSIIYRQASSSSTPNVSSSADYFNITRHGGDNELYMNLTCTSSRKLKGGNRYTWVVVKRKLG